VPLRAAVSRDRVLLASGTHQQATPRPRGVPRRLPGAQRATSGTLAVFFAVAPSAARVAVKQTASARFKAYGSGGGTNLDAMAAPTRTIEARGRGGGSVGWALRTGRPRPYWAVRSPGNARARQIGQRTASTHAVHTRQPSLALERRQTPRRRADLCSQQGKQERKRECGARLASPRAA